jgi:hypothetical protein
MLCFFAAAFFIIGDFDIAFFAGFFIYSSSSSRSSWRQMTSR